MISKFLSETGRTDFLRICESSFERIVFKWWNIIRYWAFI